MMLATMMASLPLMAAVPIVPTESVSTSQDAETSVVTVNYALSGAPGIVTIDIQTNAGENVWTSIGGKHQRHWAGDVNRLVPADEGKTRTAKWAAAADWPGFRLTENVRAVVTAWATNAPPNYMVLDLGLPTNAYFYTEAEALPGGVGDRIYKTDKLVLRRIPAANVVWNKGSPSGEKGRDANREGAQAVRLTKDYYIGVYEFTQAQYRRLYTTSEYSGVSRPTFTSAPNAEVHPIDSIPPVSVRGKLWSYGAKEEVTSGSVLGRLRSRTGVMLDLPTAAQWEFACRAGCSRAYYNGYDPASADAGTADANLDRIAWYSKNGADDPDLAGLANQTHEVGLKEPNGFGLYDILGNVQEYGLDWNTKDFTPHPGVDVDPMGPAERSADGNEYNGYVWCGGAYNKSATGCRASSRYSWSTGGANEVGVRVCAPAETVYFNEEAK